MFTCVKEKMDAPPLCVILPYLIFSCYLNLIQTKKDIISEKEGRWTRFLYEKDQERKGQEGGTGRAWR